MSVKVDFHSGMPDKAAYCCRLLRKSQATRSCVAVCGPSDLLDRLDVALWTFDALSFLPHVRLRAECRRSPAWRAPRCGCSTMHGRRLIAMSS